MPTTASGESAGSVVSRYSSRCVPVASLTNTHRTGTSPHPPLYQCPTPVAASTRRVPPPYHATDSRVRGAVAVACRGLGRRAPLTRGRPLPAYGGGGVNRLMSGWHLLTNVSRARWRWQDRANPGVPVVGSPA